MTFAIVRVTSTAAMLDLQTFARAAQIHPELVRRLVVLGLLEARLDPGVTVWLSSAQLPVVARIQRLRAGLGVNYANLGLVMDLLDRVADLERELHRITIRQSGNRSRFRQG
jgi:chaperone modulatory protein CbpM